MPKQSQKATSTKGESVEDRLKDWRGRVEEAEKLHDSWEDMFECRKLHSMWAGPGQWPPEDNEDGDKYAVNLFFSGIESKRPSLVFRVPFVRVRAKPSRTDDPANTSEYRAKLFEDTLNTILGDKRVGVLNNCALALHEAFFRFGVVEVGIAGDVTENPRAGRPALDPESGKEYEAEGKKVLEPDYLVSGELPYVRRIPAEQVFVSVSNKNDLLANDFVGYCDYVRIEDIRANPFYKNVKGLEATAKLKANRSGYIPEDKAESNYAQGRCKLYKLWDLRTKKRYVFSDTGDGFLIDGEPWKILPLRILKFHEILDSYYPKPPTYDWVQPQREANDERESMKVHRKRFSRKYSVLRGKVDPREQDKLEIGDDGTMIEVGRHEDIAAIQDAPMDPINPMSYSMTLRDFVEVSGIGSEQRQIAESDTATQANIINTKGQIRESYDRELVAAWLSGIAQTLLGILYEQASLPFWIYTNVDPFSPNAMAEAQEIAMSFQLMRPEYLEDFAEWEISVDMASMVPAVEERDKQNWLMALQTLSNPQMAQLCMASDVILRQTLTKFNIRAEKEIQEIKRALHQVLTFNMNLQIMMASGMPIQPPVDLSSSGKPSLTAGGGGVQGATGAGPGPTPGNAAIMQQLMAQMPQGVAPRG